MAASVTSSSVLRNYRTATREQAMPEMPLRRRDLHFSSVVDLVAMQSRTNPQALAVSADDRSITYGELTKRANQLAAYLVNAGVGPETIVALCLDRSVESVVCALAVLKAGGAYLPLDPAYPIERLDFMLGDAQPRVLIARGELARRLPSGSWELLELDSALGFDANFAETVMAPIRGDQLAYVIYTSGSTGQPKGVEITHTSLMNLVSWHQNEFQVSTDDKASHFASVGFDASVWEVWPYLTAGATLCLPDEETRLSPERLRDWLVENEITISFLPTALAEQLMILNWPENTSLRYLLTGADTLHRYPANGLPFTLVNNYGPSECTVVATSGKVLSSDANDTLPSIGQPIANTQVYLLDESLQPVETGTPGEIYIGGAGVARGYLNRPDLTNERFISNPFSNDPGARLYRTGDLGRQMPNGKIAYLGRVDEQIKILGYRIEPGEIEAVLDRHPAVAASVVLARGSACDQKRLTAYLTTHNAATPSACELRTFLRAALPDYMVPSVFVQVRSLPLTQNGKVNRQALPEPTIENTLRDEEFTAPSSLVEKRLANILCTLLNLRDVSVNDNFFLLGGHSLLGTQLIVKIRNAFGVELSLRTLFDAPTIAELSSEIERLIVARVESMSEEEAQALLA